MTTICAKCEHFICKGDIWYDQFCSHTSVRRKKATDPVTGKRGFNATNDLGSGYITEEPYPYARDINQGGCLHFSPKHLRVVDRALSIIPGVSP